MTSEALSTFLVDYHYNTDCIYVNSQWLQSQLLQKNRLQLAVTSLENQLKVLQSRYDSLSIASKVYKDFYHSSKYLDIKG